MYLNYKESIFLAKKLAQARLKAKNIELAVFPTALALSAVKVALSKTRIKIGAQNCAWTPKGAYTGAISALMFKEAGCKYVLVGHSERRYVFNESNEDIRKKIEAALDANLIPVLCVGESQKDNEESKTEYRLKKQLMEGLQGLKIDNNKIIVAYEPVWSIGTGNPCNPGDANDRHGFIKNELKQYITGEVPVIYGGSVNKDNAASYLKLETVNGILVGGASVKIDNFIPLVKAIK